MMLDFLDRFEAVLADWPDGEKLSFHQLSDRTSTPIPHVIEYVCLGLGKSYDVHDMISRRESDNALNSLKQKLRTEIEAKERRVEAQRNRALDGYRSTMDKVRQKLLEKNSYGAYRTLSYFAGNNEQHLDRETKISIANDCLRIGFKAEVNKQELAGWLQKAVKACLAIDGDNGVEDAKDLIECYAESFASGNDARMKAFVDGLQSMIQKIISPMGSMSSIQVPELSVQAELGVSKS